MRLWSINLKYLDTKGLLAVWREGLLAKKVFENKTNGYKKHPQLIRFKQYKYPLKAINAYLTEIYREAKIRGYNFNKNKIKIQKLRNKIKVTSGQIEFEFQHLLKKLKKRNFNQYLIIKKIKNPKIISIFTKIKGPKEFWEK